MFDRNLAGAIFLCWLLIPSIARSQHIQAPDTESMKRVGRSSSDQASPDLLAVAKSIIAKTNEFRREENRSEVGVNTELAKAADYFAKYMAQTNKYGHNADGSQPADRVKKFGYEYCIVAENIAYEYDSTGFSTVKLSDKFFEGWQRSPGHRKNMLDPDVTETGVAVARSEETQYFYAVQVFARPKSKSIAFQVTNETGDTVHYEIAGQQFSLPPQYTRSHERCRSADLVLDRAVKNKDSPERAQPVRPANVDHFVIRKEDGTYRVRRS